MEKFLRVVVTCSVVIFLSVAMFAGGFVTGNLTARSDLPLVGSGGTSPTAGGTPSDLQATFGTFWEAWDIVHDEYVSRPLDDTKLMQGAIRGMMRALDDTHSVYLDPEENQLANTPMDGELEGIGATVEEAGDYVRIASPMPGSPAEAAGILPEDIVLEVDGKDINGLGLTRVVLLIRGKAGTKVKLLIQRPSTGKQIEFEITRAKILIPSVESRMEGDIAYVKINNFGEKTTAELRAALQEVMGNNPKGLVLDLRNNPGGLLRTAIDVMSQLVPSGQVVMLEKFGDGRERTYEAESGGLATEIPLVVLINKGSASASEIVAGAVQDLKRGTVVGETSYGKGSVQNVHQLDNDAGQLRVTIALWYTPNGRTIHKQGIQPDTEVELTDEDRTAKRDPQLEKALEILGK